MVRRGKPNSDLKRKRGKREQRETILIVCEGECTEPAYFKLLRHKLRLSFRVEGKSGSAAISVVKYAQSLKKQAIESTTRDKYDKIFCIIDVEVPPQGSLSAAIPLATKEKFKIILSNPCFEFWYLLHFGVHNAYFSSPNQCVNQLKTKYPNYKKSGKDQVFLEKIFSYTSNAITNSKRVVGSNCTLSKLQNKNPSTNVHELVEHLVQLSQQYKIPIATKRI